MKKNENTKMNVPGWQHYGNHCICSTRRRRIMTGNQKTHGLLVQGGQLLLGVAMLLLAMTIREGQIMMNSRGLKTYKELFECLYHPFQIKQNCYLSYS